MKSFPFDSEVTYTETGEPVYDRASNSQELRDYFHLMYTDGVFPNPSTGLQVVAYSEEMSVSVLPGNVIIRGAFGIEESTRTLVFEAAGTAYDRIDAVVARLNTNYNYRKIDLYVVKGVESASPVAPELTREGGIYELRLANVFIAKNTTTITTERITDTRLNTDDCGIVTANPKVVDTTAIFDQYQASLDKYLKYVKECIDGTTAANLQNQIDEVNSNLIFKTYESNNVTVPTGVNKSSPSYTTINITDISSDDYDIVAITACATDNSVLTSPSNIDSQFTNNKRIIVSLINQYSDAVTCKIIIKVIFKKK